MTTAPHAIGLSVCLDPQRPWRDMAAIAGAADSVGVHALYVPDHFMPDDESGRPVPGPFLEAWTCLTALACATRTSRVGPLVLGCAYRYPAVVAKMAATLDQISGGRVVLGVGAGWQVNEHRAYGIPLLGTGARFDRFDEACRVVSGLLRDPVTSFDGRYYQLVDAICDPRPVQTRLPILVGGGGERRTLPIAARYADAWQVWGSLETFRRKSRLLTGRCAAAGRDPSAIRRIAGGPIVLGGACSSADDETLSGSPVQVAAMLAAYRDAGADEFVVSDDAEWSAERTIGLLNGLVAEVLPHVPRSVG